MLWNGFYWLKELKCKNGFHPLQFTIFLYLFFAGKNIRIEEDRGRRCQLSKYKAIIVRRRE
jgi:hypothetical protein